MGILWPSLKQIHPQKEEEIALFGNLKKCGLKYHLKCINYGQLKLVDLFVITMAICMPNLIKVYALLVELLSKWSSSYQKWKKRTKITGKAHHL